MAFLNFSLWLFDSFELQKSKASMVESDFYGAFVWVWMQRITLPLCIFFRQDKVSPSLYLFGSGCTGYTFPSAISSCNE